MKTNKFLVAGFVLLLIPILLFSMPYARYTKIVYPIFPPQYTWEDLGGTVESICISEDFEIWAQTDAEKNTLNPGEYWTYEWQYVHHTAIVYPYPFPTQIFYSTGVTSRNFNDIHNPTYLYKVFRCIVKKFSATHEELSSEGNIFGQEVTIHIDDNRYSILSQPQDINGKCEGDLIILDFNVDFNVDCKWLRRLVGNTGWQDFSPFLDDPYYTFNATSDDEEYEYACGVWNGCGYVQSNVIQLNLLYPPQVSDHPDDRSICEETGTTISVSMENTSYTYAYQWQMRPSGGTWANVSGSNFSGATTNELVISNITNPYNNYQFQCYATSSCSPGAYSNAATLTVKANPVITSSPSTPTVCEEGSYSYTTVATGYSPLEYRWEKSAVVVSDWSTNNQFQLENITTAMAGSYNCFVQNECGTTNTSLINLSVTELPVIKTISGDISICEGDDTPIGITVTTSGDVNSLIYEESVDGGTNWVELATEPESTTYYSLPVPTASMDGYQYRVIAFGDCEPSDTSDIVNLEVKTIPVITTAPEDITACEGKNISFNVVASGSPTLEYRWKKGGSTLGDWSVTSSLLLEEVTTDDYDDYYVQIRNGCTGLNVIESDVVTLVVHPSPTVSLGADKHLCPGSSIELSPGTGYASYAWSTDETTSSITVSNSGNYEVTITDQHSCSNSDKVLVIEDPTIPVLNLGEDIVVCLGEDIIIDASDQYDIYNWLGDETTQSISVTESGTYSVTVKRNISVCEESDKIQVDIFSPYEDEEICMISIEKESGKNMIIWEKTDDVGTEFFQVWRQTNVQNEYIMIHESAYGDESIFIDTETNPEVKSELYKIIVLDTCGNYSEASLSHKPMFLTSSLGANEDEINLAWTPYLIDNAEINFPSYIIYRGEGTGVLEPIDTIAAGAGTNLYTDANPPPDVDLFYRIAGVKEDPCDPNNLLDSKKGESGPFIHSYSNLEDNRIKSTGLFNKSAASGLKLFPNPMTNETRIILPENCSLPVTINIIDVNGRIMRSIICNEKDILIRKENLTAGIYIVMVISENIMYDKLMLE